MHLEVTCVLTHHTRLSSACFTMVCLPIRRCIEHWMWFILMHSGIGLKPQTTHILSHLGNMLRSPVLSVHLYVLASLNSMTSSSLFKWEEFIHTWRGLKYAVIFCYIMFVEVHQNCVLEWKSFTFQEDLHHCLQDENNSASNFEILSDNVCSEYVHLLVDHSLWHCGHLLHREPQVSLELHTRLV